MTLILIFGRPSIGSSLKITNRSFPLCITLSYLLTHLLTYLFWNQLSHSLRKSFSFASIPFQTHFFIIFIIITFAIHRSSFFDFRVNTFLFYKSFPSYTAHSPPTAPASRIQYFCRLLTFSGFLVSSFHYF